MDWEVFHQTTLILIPTPTCLTELTSKKEGNCNVMIKGPADYGLHVTHQLHPFVLKSYMPQPHLPRYRYELFFVSPHRHCNLISLVSTWLSINTNSFWSRSSTRRIWAEQAVCFYFWSIREDYLHINAFPNLVVVEREEYLYAQQRKATGGGAMNQVVRRRLAGHGLAWSLGRQYQLLSSTILLDE